jgi:hypothetical protein
MITATVTVGKYKVNIPNDIEIRISHEPRITSIQTIPHSPSGERFAYEATEAERAEFLKQVLVYNAAKLQEVER